MHWVGRRVHSSNLRPHGSVVYSFASLFDYRTPYRAARVDHADSLYPDKMFTHRKYFCGEGAQRTEAQSKTQRKKGAAPCESFCARHAVGHPRVYSFGRFSVFRRSARRQGSFWMNQNYCAAFCMPKTLSPLRLNWCFSADAC